MNKSPRDEKNPMASIPQRKQPHRQQSDPEPNFRDHNPGDEELNIVSDVIHS